MARINVTRVLRNRNFCKTLNVTRRASTVTEQGLTAIVETTLTPLGVVVAGSVPPFVQDTDYQHARNTITVYTQERLLDPALSHQPDIVNESGNRYIVRRVYDWSTWGSGWYAAECELLDLETSDA